MQLLYPEMVVAGALPAAVMAVAVDLAFVALERLARRRVAAGGREGAAPQAENLAAV